MKKIFTVAAMVLTAGAFAQKNTTSPSFISYGAAEVNQFSNKADTTILAPAFVSDTACGLGLYRISFDPANTLDSGFVTGYNAYGDREKGQHFSTSLSNAKVNAAFAFFAVKGSVPGADTTTFVAKVYSVNMTDTTITLLGSSLPVSFTNIDTTTANGFQPTPFLFPTPVPVSGDFIISFEVAKFAGSNMIAGAAILSSTVACGDGGAFELWYDNTPSFIEASFGLPIDLFTGVMILSDNNVSVETAEEGATFSMFPNPAANNATIAYNIVNGGKVSMQVTNMAGQVVINLNEGFKNAGSYTRTLDLSSLSNGIYVYSINVDGKASKGKFVVAK